MAFAAFRHALHEALIEDFDLRAQFGALLVVER